jgi:RNA polymerase sigma-70 factor, ECF subfamily
VNIDGGATTSHAAARYSRTVANRNKRERGPMRLLNAESLTVHADTLLRAAWALCGSREDAEDLVQETFARVLARPRLLRGEGSDLAYLLRALRNTFLIRRREAVRLPVSTATLDEVTVADPRPSVAPESALVLGQLYEAIARLPEHYRLALVAVDLLGLSYGEAGEALAVREETVTSRLFRARRLIAREFSGPLAAGTGSVREGAAAGEEAGRPVLEQRVR